MNEEKQLRQDLKHFSEIKRKKYRDQAIWFLNSYEYSHESKTCELVWKMHKKCAEIDDLKEEGIGLNNEVTVHRVLEYSGAPATNTDLRNFLSNINSNYNTISLIEILLFRFKVDWRNIVNAPLCYDKKVAQIELHKAKEELESVLNAKETACNDAKLAQHAEETAACEEEKASKAVELFLREEACLSLPREKTEAALLCMKSRENKIEFKVKDLELVAFDDTKGIVKRNRAKAELAMLQNENPLPLRTAIVQNEASVKKLQKSADSCRRAAVAAEAAKLTAEGAKLSAQKAKRNALNAAKDAEVAITRAMIAFERLKTLVDKMVKQQTLPRGLMFYINREVKETAKFLPNRRLKERKIGAEYTKKSTTTSCKQRYLYIISV